MYDNQDMFHTSADDLKSNLQYALDTDDPADVARGCLNALIASRGKGMKTHRKHIATALRAAVKKLEEDSKTHRKHIATALRAAVKKLEEDS